MLTDVVMPHLNGRELAERVAPLRPDMKVLYMSGHTDDAIVHYGVLEAGMAFIQKPFSPDALAIKIRELLDTPGAPAGVSHDEGRPARNDEEEPAITPPAKDSSDLIH